MRSTLTVAVAAALTVFACGGSATSPTGAPSTFTVLLKDSPFSDAKSLLVTFSEVTAHRDGEGGFTKLPFGDTTAASRTCDLKKLVDRQDLLGVGMLPEGHYTQVRLVVSSAALYFDNPSDGPACATSMAVPGLISTPSKRPNERRFPSRHSC